MLFTSFGAEAAHRATILESREAWEATHQANTLTCLIGFKPKRTFGV